MHAHGSWSQAPKAALAEFQGELFSLVEVNYCDDMCQRQFAVPIPLWAAAGGCDAQGRDLDVAAAVRRSAWILLHEVFRRRSRNNYIVAHKIIDFMQRMCL